MTLPVDERTEFLTVGFTPFDTDSALDWVLAAHFSFDVLVTPNVSHVVRARSDADLAHALEQSDLVLCDSQVIRRLAAIFRYGKLPLCRGSDLTERLFDSISEAPKPYTLGVIGGTAEQVAILKKRYGLQVKAHHVPPIRMLDVPGSLRAAAEFVRLNRCDIWLLAVGSPQQEMLASRAKAVAGYSSVALCVGASLDFLSGKEARAPAWMQRAGLEWLWRLLLDPRGKMRRYLLENPRVFTMLIADLFRRGRA